MQKQNFLESIPSKKESKVNFEFQELGLELQPIYGKVIWSLFHKVGFTEQKIRRAHEVCKQKGILKLAYLIGCVKRDRGL